MFEPYIKPHGIGNLRFFYANEEARAWYDPLKPYTLLEYEWIRENVDFWHQIVIDAGVHHGNYAVVFYDAGFIFGFDIVQSNIDIADVNINLNFRGQSYPGYKLINTRLGKGNGAKKHIALDPTIYKMDIEGSEFELMPQEIDDLPTVHTWIVEIHPHAGDPNTIAQAFADRGFELLKVDRERMVVRPYVLGERWLTHATLIARKTIKVIGLPDVSISKKIAGMYP